MIKATIIGLGAAAILGFAVLPIQNKVPRTKMPTSNEPGALMAAGYDAVFNDLELLDKYGPGVSRVMNNPLTAHPGLSVSNKDASEGRLFNTREGLMKEGWVMEEGVFTLIKELWQNVRRDPSDNRTGPSNMRSIKVALWWPSRWSRGYEGLFGNGGRWGSPNDPRLLDFADEATTTLSKNPNGIFKKKIGDWQLYAESIFLRKKECLNCHKSMKLNEPIAIAAFAYKKH